MRFNNIDGINQFTVKRAIEAVKHGELGTWLLCHALTNPEKSNEELFRSEWCEYVVFKDHCVVVFYTDDLEDTPRSDLKGPSEHTRKCVREISKMKRWIGTESMHCTVLEFQVVIVAYNLSMNEVGRFDQFRATNTLVLIERRVNISVFTFLLDASYFT